MFQSLRWKIIGAFALTILLTIILSGAFSVWTTASRFDVLVTSEGLYTENGYRFTFSNV